jgi:hypothetical protein
MRHVLLIIALTILGCPPPKPAPTPHNYTPATCAEAQVNLEKVCPKRAKTPAGKTYAVLCEEDKQKNVDLNPSCAAASKSCEEFEACPQQ